MDLHNNQITLGEILSYPPAREVLKQELPGLYGSPLMGMARGMSLQLSLIHIYSGVTYYTMPIGILVTPQHVITVSLRENAIISEFAEGVVKGVQTDLKTQFVLHIMLRVATRYLQFLKQIDKLSSLLEKQLRKSMKNKELIQLLDVQKSLVYFSTSLKADETTPVSNTHLRSRFQEKGLRRH